MTMHANRFLAQYKRLKGHIDSTTASAELQEAFVSLVDAFKQAYSADTLKQALAADEAISSELEERLTSALVIYNRERTVGTSGDVPDE